MRSSGRRGARHGPIVDYWSEDSSSDGYFVPSSSTSQDASSTSTEYRENTYRENVLHNIEVNQVAGTPPSSEVCHGVKEATEFLHQDIGLLIAAEMADDNMLRILINEGTNIHLRDHLGRNALHFAVHSEKLKVVDTLLKAGVDPNVQDHLGMTPLTLCLMRSPNVPMVSLLLEYGALLTPRRSPVEPGMFLQFVMMCVPTREEESILRLLVNSAGALVNDPDAPAGRQALHFAAMSNNTRLIKILVHLGGDVLTVNHRNETPKQVAAMFHNKEAYALLQRFENMTPGTRSPTASELDKESRRECQGSS